MALTSMDGLIAGLQPIPTFWGKQGFSAQSGIPSTPIYVGGTLGAAANPTGGLNGATLSGVTAGFLSGPTPVAGQVSAIVKATATQGGFIGAVWLVDRLWNNVPVVTTTTAQAITSPTWPARDASASTNGAAVFLALECFATTGNGSPITNTTVSYTNSAGVAGRTATVPSWPTGGLTGTFVILSLQAGDVGVRSVQSITLGTSYVSGSISLVAFRFICSIPTPTANVETVADFTQLGLPRVWDNSVIQPVLVCAGNTTAVYGDLSFAQG